MSSQFPEKLIPLIILNALDGKSLPIFGKGIQIPDWHYVDDHVRALIIFATKCEAGETFNFGGQNEKQNIYVMYTLCYKLDELCPKTLWSFFIDQINYFADLHGHDMRYAFDTSKIQRELS